MSGDRDERDLDSVRIPSELHDLVGRFFSELKQETIRKACLRAIARVDEDEVCVLQSDDVVAVARKSLSDASTTADKMIGQQELNNVRRAS